MRLADAILATPFIAVEFLSFATRAHLLAGGVRILHDGLTLGVLTHLHVGEAVLSPDSGPQENSTFCSRRWRRANASSNCLITCEIQSRSKRALENPPARSNFGMCGQLQAEQRTGDDDWVLRDVSPMSPGKRSHRWPHRRGENTLISLLLRFYDVQKGRFCWMERITGAQLAGFAASFWNCAAGSFLLRARSKPNIAWQPDRTQDVEHALHEVGLGSSSFTDDGADTVVTSGARRFPLASASSSIRGLFAHNPRLCSDEATFQRGTKPKLLIASARPAAYGRTALVIAQLSTIQPPTASRLHKGSCANR